VRTGQNTKNPASNFAVRKVSFKSWRGFNIPRRIPGTAVIRANDVVAPRLRSQRCCALAIFAML